jgi:hypothetical protein
MVRYSILVHNEDREYRHMNIVVLNVNSTLTDVTLIIHMLYMHIPTLTQCLVLIQISIQVNHTSSSLNF